MELIRQALDVLLHIDQHLTTLIQHYGLWTYAILFLVVFCETGLVVTPVLPGDSLLFAAGALAAQGALHPFHLFWVLALAAVLGDTVNYWIGYAVGPTMFAQGRVRCLKKEHLDRAHRFYERYGGKTIVLARFMPIIRTFAPFVAGIARMTYRRFIAYNIVGGIVWVALFIYGGYHFGNLQLVRHHFSLVIFAIIVLSILPALIEALRHRRPSVRP